MPSKRRVADTFDRLRRSAAPQPSSIAMTEQEIVLMWMAMYMRAWQPMTVADLWQVGVTVVGGNYSAKIRSLSRRTVMSQSGCGSCRTPAEIHDSAWRSIHDTACRPW